MRKSLIAGLAIAGVAVGAIAYADNHVSDAQKEAAVKARKAHMTLYAFNLGTLGAMAKEEMPYDAAAATAAADAIAALAQLPQSGYWLPGTDNQSMEKTRALPAIWADGSDVGTKAGDLVKAAMEMQTAAAMDLDSLKAAMGPLGASCGGCHKSFRQPDE
ncbi:cytochrome c [Aliiroseovarius sp. Z3]|uniref:c-type cytochrome n=1 Tax=Aliiroseovarius sp. Z3 TaxID=2811402 RepID=UPI0023B22A0C|nr:cytochrome c [Aliiroseovarius sp. Z3]MDE9449319.1 cytochrome c [Aliiroseovarius sp. Z3]